jgi:carotenoid cleavage dioxygenase-like enzyme
MEDMTVTNDRGHQVTARRLMEIMLYDNGAINRLEPDNLRRYPKKNFEAITNACDAFFTAHPDLLTDENTEEIAAGEYEENQTKFGTFKEYTSLDKALNDFFDRM